MEDNKNNQPTDNGQSSASQPPLSGSGDIVISHDDNTTQHTPVQPIAEKKNALRYIWYYLPLVAILLIAGITQIVTNHVCAEVPNDSKGECIPGLWFFPLMAILSLGFIPSIVAAIVGTVRIFKDRKKNNNQLSEQPQVVVGSSTEPQPQIQPMAQSVQSAVSNQRVLKTWLLISFSILVLNTQLLLLTFIPLVGAYIAIGYAPILLVTGIFALANFFIALFVLHKKYFTGGFRKLTAIVLVLSVVGVVGGLPALYINISSHRIQTEGKKMTAYYEQSNATARSDATVEQATQLLNSCQVFGFYYTNQDATNDSENAEKTSTGILLYRMPKSYNGMTTSHSSNAGKYRMHIADRVVSTMVPIARNAQQKCGIQFWHDGDYEQWKDGQWYFNGAVVQNIEPGKTKAEAISFMQSCKADYFVGYTDINLIKDASTKSWLNKAEQSSNGIEILEGSPKSYVFTSKSMTKELQYTARQYRQACYSQKKLYVTIDNWIETEYPVGKWTKVNQ